MPSSSLLWSVGSLALSTLVSPAIATGGTHYQLLEAWQGQNFLDYFEFFDGGDPTNGFVTYVNQSHAESSGLINITPSGSLYMGVDHETTLSPTGPGRESVRIETKRFYDEGLYVVDIKHMPGSICGTWPAFWSVGPSWPGDGEIDIIEGVNKHDSNKIVLHTSGSCDVGGSNDMSGTMTSGECGEASGTIGCVVEGEKGSSGDPFNAQGGGVYAMEWKAEFIKIWFFPRKAIPTSITSGNPNTAEFGIPMAHLQGTCDFHERFTAQKFIFNTAFCGDWAGGIFGDSGCPISDPSSPMNSCANYVATNPAAFKDAYWEINSIKLFKLGITPVTPPLLTSAISSATTAAIESAVTSEAHGGETDKPAALPNIASTTTSAAEPQRPATTSHKDVPVPSNPTDVDPTRLHGGNQDSQPTTAAAPTGNSPVGNDNGEAKAPKSKMTRYVTETTTICPKTQAQGGSIATTPPAAAVPSAGDETATAPVVPVPVPTGVDSHAHETDANPETLPVAVPTAPPAPPVSEPAPEPSDAVPPPEEPAAPSSQESVHVNPPTSVAPIGTPKPSASSPSGFVPVPTTAVSSAGATGGSDVPSATTPASPVFTGAASTLTMGISSLVGVLAVIFVL
ncbi:hypothetical protein FE257_003640 [Aspergillus nanangensis]|uniref:endo-1,3(4)-beta-glucanase n=1 Tax=Aspergillus nanangensis TaxID=2582783 RepID=A0AAD4GVE5_ASPNN|nr:hypothetical protein FE257_003640 [Aspergillus nanangensis]